MIKAQKRILQQLRISVREVLFFLYADVDVDVWGPKPADVDVAGVLSTVVIIGAVIFDKGW